MDLSSSSPTLRAAPKRWIDTRSDKRPKARAINFDFCGSLMSAVPGRTWSEIKGEICGRGLKMSPDFRLRCVRDLVFSLAILEQFNVVHGDLSPGNIIIDPDAGPEAPALYLIDFDAFVYEFPSGETSCIRMDEGGTYGTPGYCPPELELKDAQDPTKHPFSDRFGRDMLIIELLAFGAMMDHEQAPREWDQVRLQRRLRALVSHHEKTTNVGQLIEQMIEEDVLFRTEERRSSSTEYASLFSLDLRVPLNLQPTLDIEKPSVELSQIDNQDQKARNADTVNLKKHETTVLLDAIDSVANSSRIPSQSKPSGELEVGFLFFLFFVLVLVIGFLVYGIMLDALQYQAEERKAEQARRFAIQEAKKARNEAPARAAEQARRDTEAQRKSDSLEEEARAGAAEQARRDTEAQRESDSLEEEARAGAAEQARRDTEAQQQRREFSAPENLVPRKPTGRSPPRSRADHLKPRPRPSRPAIKGREAYLNARKLKRMDKTKEAVEKFNQADRDLTNGIEKMPGRPLLYYMRGLVRLNISGKEKEADLDFQQGVKFEDKQPGWKTVIDTFLIKVNRTSDRLRLADYRNPSTKK